MTTKLIIFDLDGTLLYTLEDLKNSVNFALKKYGLKERNLEEIRNFVGNGIQKLIERAIGENQDKFEVCFKAFNENYKTNNSNTYPYEGTIETLKKLKEKNIKIAVLSNKADNFVKELSDFYFKGLVDFSMGENPNFPKKPDGKSTLYIIEKFKVKKEETIFIGDSEVDIQTAKNAGIKCISASWGYKDKDFLIKNKAQIIIDNLKEILIYI